jgi:hypothetical protein
MATFMVPPVLMPVKDPELLVVLLPPEPQLDSRATLKTSASKHAMANAIFGGRTPAKRQRCASGGVLTSDLCTVASWVRRVGV